MRLKFLCNTSRESLVYQLILVITKYCECRSLLKLNRLDRNQPNVDILDIAMHWCAISNLLDKLPAATYNDSTQVGLWNKYWQLSLQYFLVVFCESSIPNIDSYVCSIFLHLAIIWFRAEQRFPRDLVCATYLEQVPPLSFVSCWSGVMFFLLIFTPTFLLFNPLHTTKL